jgi:hypothetical protein
MQRARQIVGQHRTWQLWTLTRNNCDVVLLGFAVVRGLTTLIGCHCAPHSDLTCARRRRRRRSCADPRRVLLRTGQTRVCSDAIVSVLEYRRLFCCHAAHPPKARRSMCTLLLTLVKRCVGEHADCQGGLCQARRARSVTVIKRKHLC